MNYTIEICIPNIKHAPFWWNGKPIYEFETMQEVTEFIKNHFPNEDRYINFMIENDKKTARGSLGCTSWYQVRKGARLMTDYTAF